MGKSIKKFYTDVSLKEIEDRYVVQLDGRAAKTVGRCLLGASSEKLSQAIADEWRGQEDVIDLSTMPLTKLQGVILDHQDEEDWQNFILSYLNTDLLCYWSTDEKLAQRQDQTWRPLLERVGQQLGASFKTTKTIIAVEQSEALQTAFHQKIKTKSAQEQFCLKLLTEMTGSAILGLALIEKTISPDGAFTASRLDETYQSELWGVDAEAAEREKNLYREFNDIIRFLTLSKT